MKNRIISYIVLICVIAVTYVTVMYDSLIGIVMLAVGALYLLRNAGCLSELSKVMQFALVSVIIMECVYVIYATGYLPIESVLIEQLSGKWLHPVLLICIIVYYFADEKKQLQGNRITPLIKICSMVIIMGCIISVTVAVCYWRNASSVRADQLADGAQVILILEDKSGTLACTDTQIFLEKYKGNDEQVFTIQASDVEGYYKITASNGKVLDVNGTLFEEGNTVIAWDENGVTGQLWKLIDNGGCFIIESYDPQYVLDVDSNGITSLSKNRENPNSKFLLLNAHIKELPVIGWMISGLIRI
jgi:hypothetical protein